MPKGIGYGKKMTRNMYKSFMTKRFGKFGSRRQKRYARRGFKFSRY